MRNNKHPRGYFYSGTASMESGNFETEEVELFEKLLSKNDRFINVGANTGYYVCIAALKDKPVTAFEPLDSNLKILYKNLILNNWKSKVEIFPIAIGSNIGINKIYGYGTGASLVKNWANSDFFYFKFVPTSTLDSSLSQRFQNEKLLILVDIEGFELEMLIGAKKTLQLIPKPQWIIEIAFDEHMPIDKKFTKAKKCFHLLWSAGYKSYFADTNFIEFTLNDLNKIIKNKEMAPISNNFLFIDKKINPEL